MRPLTAFRPACLFVLLWVGSAIAAPAQLMLQAAAQRAAAEDVGTVSGHVQCSDTQRPARLASVRLVPVNVPPVAAKGESNFDAENSALGGALPPVETDLNGNYVAHNVRPGSYYLRIDYPGYLTPLLSFTREQLAHPSVDVQQRMASTLQVVTVAPRSSTTADATLQRAGSLSGTVRYDDGSPAPNVTLALFTRNGAGTWVEFNHYAGNVDDLADYNTDAAGHYHINRVPQGEYLLAARFSLSETSVTTMPMPGFGSGTMQMNIQKVLFSLDLYNGDVFRSRDATPLKLDAGQALDGVDLTLPLAKLHGVTGSVLAKDGHTIRHGRVTLRWADATDSDGKGAVADVPIDAYDGQFHMPYVPEGNYTLTVEQASDVTQIEVANPPGMTPRTHTEDKTVRTYGQAQQPLSVQNDEEGILITAGDPGTNAASGASH